MAVGKVDAERLLREERARTEREIAGIRESANARIAEIHRDSAQRQKAMESRLAEIERDLQEARKNMETEMVRSMERQKAEVRAQMAELQRATEARLQAQAREMRAAWEKAYKELDARIRRIDARIDETLAKERDHAKVSIERARACFDEFRHSVSVQRFGTFWIEHLQNMLNSAIDEFNAGYSVPADGQALLTISECSRCEAEADERSARWEPHHRRTRAMWQARRDRLSVMESPMRIEAAELEMEEVMLSVWNSEGWKQIAGQLAEIEAMIDAPAPCSLEELAMAQTMLQALEDPIEEVIGRAEAAAVRFLYLICVMDEIVALAAEHNDGWCETCYQTELVVNRGRAVLHPNGVEGDQPISIELSENPKTKIVRVNISNSSYDHSTRRRAQLKNIFAELAERLDGVNGPLVRFGNAAEYTDGDAVCIGFDMIVPGKAGAFMTGAPDDRTEEGKKPEQSVSGADTKEATTK